MLLSEAQRQQLAEDFSRGVPIASLMRRFNVSRKTAERWARRGQSSDHPTYADAPRSGRPRTSSRPRRRHSPPEARPTAAGSVPGVTRTLNVHNSRRQPGTGAAVATVVGGRGRALSEANRAKRLAFCQRHRGSQCGAWVYGASKCVYLYKDGAGRLQQGLGTAAGRSHQQQQQQQRGGGVSSRNPTVLHCYAFVAKGYKSRLYFTPPTPPTTGTTTGSSSARQRAEPFTSEHFQALLPRVKGDLEAANKWGRRHPIVLDHATQHDSGPSQQTLAQQGFALLQDVPPQSRDINAMHEVWGLLDDRQAAQPGRRPTTTCGWRRRVVKAWGEVGQPAIDRLVAAVPDRLADIEQREGAWLPTA